MGKHMGLGLLAATGISLLVACGVTPTSDEAARSEQARLEGGYFYLWAPPDGSVGASFPVSSVVAYYPPDPGKVLSDVTITMTVSGTFTAGTAFPHDGHLTCTQTEAPASGAAPASVTVTCHADQLEAGAKTGVQLDVVPSADGAINTTSSLSVGGSVVESYSASTLVHPNTGADLAVSSWPSGFVFLGQEARAHFFADNRGPTDATGVKLTFTLSGPGKLTFVAPPLYGPPPPPPPGMPPPPPPPAPPPNPCTWTDTTSTCELGTLNVWNGLPIELGFVGTAPGQVTIDASIAGNEVDWVPGNNSYSAVYSVIKPVVADLSVSVTDTPDPAMFKKPLAYTIVVTNNGPDAASQAFLNDWLPSDLPIVSTSTSQGSCFTAPWGFVECDLGGLAPGASATVEVVVKPEEGGTITNSVWVQNRLNYIEWDPDYTNNSAMATTTVKGPNPPVQVTSSVERFPVALFEYVPCANDFVFLEGDLHISSHSFLNQKSGRYQYESLVNPSGLTGQGTILGDTYHANGPSHHSMKWSGGFPQSFDDVYSFQVIGQGTVANLRAHVHSHVTFAADGTVKNEVYKYSFECK